MALCFVCKEQETGRGKQFTVIVDGMRFSDRAYTECTDCAGERLTQLIHGRWAKPLEKLVQCDEDLLVDWHYFSEKSAGEQQGLIAILRALQVLTSQIENGWEVVAMGPIGLNPRTTGGTYLYFSRDIDVVAFAKMCYADTVYSWHVCRHTNVMPKSEVLV
ncbi:MAG: hypothetical protein AAB539_01920 [Patescibacteria group bacterium]